MTSEITLEYELFKDFLSASLRGESARVRELGGELSFTLDNEGQKKQAKEIRALIRKHGAGLNASRKMPRLPTNTNTQIALVEEQFPSDVPLFLNERAANVVKSFCEDAEHSLLLKKNGLAPKLFLMLSGPPGTGKSLLANHIAKRLNKPLLVMRLDSLISSRLGETAKNIREVFDYISHNNGALFLDELDAIAKVRDDRQELGELKRVVNTVLQGIDSLPEEATIIAATNHPQLLDSAIWRRFPYSIEVDLPDKDVRTQIWNYFLFSDDATKIKTSEALGRVSERLSGSDIEVLSLASRRRSVLDDKPIDIFALIRAILESSQGRPSLPRNQEATVELKQSIAQRLTNEFNLSKTLLAEILGVSRQMIHRYLTQ